MADYLWHRKLYTTGDGTRYETVIVLGWHDGMATIIEVDDHGPVTGSSPHVVKAHELRLGPPPELTAVPA